MGERVCYREFCPDCDAALSVADDACPDCGTDLD
jgi:hypothetical protein